MDDRSRDDGKGVATPLITEEALRTYLREELARLEGEPHAFDDFVDGSHAGAHDALVALGRHFGIELVCAELPERLTVKVDHLNVVLPRHASGAMVYLGAGVTPETHKLFALWSTGRTEQVDPDTVVDVSAIQRFMTLARSQTGG